jgi:spore coat protein U-like protein
MIRWLALAACLLACCGVERANAASCSAYASGIAFGSYVASTAIDITGTVTVTCPNGTAYNVSLNAGMGTGGNTTTREMSGPNSTTLGYQMFQNSSHTLNWGNTVGTNTVAGTGNGNAQTYNIYAVLPAGQFDAPGSFTDTITASVTSSLPTATTQFSVTATADKSCSISATALSFGSYTGALVDSTSTVTATCSSTTTYTVGLNQGTATGATVTNRSMTGPGSALLHYSLFTNPTHTTNWGNSSGSWVSGTGNGSAQALTVYGQIPAAQYPTPGNYSDTIVATVTY